MPMKTQTLRPPEKPSVPLRPRSEIELLTRRHLVFGWWTILLFLTMCLILEGLHGLKIQGYLGVHAEMRRLMWTLAHAHGTLLGVLNLGFAFMTSFATDWSTKPRSIASAFLRAATILMPAGFFVGGLFTYSGDPGLGILLVPVAVLLLFASVFICARAATTHRNP